MSAAFDTLGAAGAERLAALHARAFDAPWAQSEFARLLALPHVFGAAHADGFVLAWAPGADAEILTLAVSPPARRRGLGTALTEAALVGAAAAGAGALILEVRADNGAALALYRRAGFEEWGKRARYYADGADAILMRRALS